MVPDFRTILVPIFGAFFGPRYWNSFKQSKNRTKIWNQNGSRKRNHFRLPWTRFCGTSGSNSASWRAGPRYPLWGRFPFHCEAFVVPFSQHIQSSYCFSVCGSSRFISWPLRTFTDPSLGTGRMMNVASVLFPSE